MTARSIRASEGAHRSAVGQQRNEADVTAALAQVVMGWTPTRDRFIESGRTWRPRWRFAPFTRIDDAFLVLERSGANFKLEGGADSPFTAIVEARGRLGRAQGEPKARVITSAIAQALGIEMDTAP